MPIEVTASDSPITVSASGTKIDATVSGGQGPAGPQGPAGATGPQGPAGATGPAGAAGSSGVVTVSAPLTNSGTSSAASLALSIGSGLEVASGQLIVSSNVARLSDVTSAVAAVVNAAPAALDTLNELAAALGNDASFASTVTNALAAKAPLANPTFTGTVSGITKSMVGLGNVQNVDATSRVNHTGTQLAATISDFASAAVAAVTWSTITGKPSTFTPAAHSHAVSDVTGLQTALDGKQPTLPGGSYLDLLAYNGSSWVSVASADYATATGLVQTGDARLSDARTPLSHTHATADVTFAATDRLLGRSSSGAGAGQEIVCTAAGRALLDDADAAAQRSTLGLGTAATAATGDFAAASHTHAQLHDRSHAITSSSDHTATAWRLFYSNGSGVVTELALGSSGQALISGGASAAPSWGSAASAVRSDTVSATTYTGRASPGTATSAATWTIRRTIYASSGAVSSTATASNVKWDDRLTASYS